MKSLNEIRCLVDLDKEQGRTPKQGKENIHRVVIRPVKVVRMDVLSAYLAGKVSMDSTVLECHVDSC